MTSNPTNNKKKLNAIDWFIIVALLLCVAGAALRAFIGTDNSMNGTVTMEKHAVFFKVENILRAKRASERKQKMRRSNLKVVRGGKAKHIAA